MFLLWLRQLPCCRDWTAASVPRPAEGRSSPTNTPVFPLVSSSYQVLHGFIYSFPLCRYSCLFLAGILPAVLCLKVYSWCIHGERCIPCPPAPPPSLGFKKICPSLKSSAHFSSFSRIRFDHFFQVQAKFYCSRLNKPSAFWDSFRLEG